MTTDFVIKPPRVEHCGPTLIYSYGCVFSLLALLSCGKIILFFLTNPQTKLGQRGTEFATATTGVDLANYVPIAPTLTDVTELAVGGTILSTNVYNPVGKIITTKTTLHNPPVAPRRPTENRTVSLKCSTYNSSNSIPLDNTIVTPIRVHALEDALCGHLDSSFVLKLCSDLRFGARLGYDGPRMSKFSKNLKSAIAWFRRLALYLKIIQINFEPFFTSRFQKREKDDFSLQYIKIDDAIAALIRLDRGTYLAKTDIESAFRQVHPDDWELLGIYWNKSYYFDEVLPFGLRSAPYIVNQLSDALEWILLNKCLISYVGHILDDFLIMEPPTRTGLPSQVCQTSLSSMLLTFRTLGVPIAEHKTEGPSLIIEFLGIIIDSQKMEARLPFDKLNRLFVDLNSWHTKKSATLQGLQSLIGTLHFPCKVITPGRAFLQRIKNITREGLQTT